MSLARLLLTAARVEGRSKSAVAREYGVADGGCTIIGRLSPPADQAMTTTSLPTVPAAKSANAVGTSDRE